MNETKVRIQSNTLLDRKEPAMGQCLAFLRKDRRLWGRWLAFSILEGRGLWVGSRLLGMFLNRLSSLLGFLEQTPGPCF